ncbi:MAG: prolyl-tRNA synthetase associated domain-containing protein [Alphaproteobacteria bacterium]|nr:prolyl-tRNA synthetase associated domain-containing protein [Alphaproteobacteria bacterium]
MASEEATADHPDHAADRARVEARLAELGVDCRTFQHPAIMTVDEGRAFKADMPGGHSKNLFVKDKKGALALVVAHCDTRVDLVAVGKAIGAKGRFSFCSADLMRATLGIEPGSVTPFAVMNAPAPALSWLVLDSALMRHETVWFHPLRNTASTGVDPQGLLAFLRAFGYEPVVLDASSPLLAGARGEVAT